MKLSSVKTRMILILLTAWYAQAGWATDEVSVDSSMNAILDQFKAARQGDKLKISDLVGDWSCAFKSLEGEENYNLVLKEKMSPKAQGKAEQGTDDLTIEAEVVRYVDKAHAKVEMRMGRRIVLSGQSSSPALREMAHDKDLDTVDSIAVEFNGGMKTLLIQRSYFYKGPYQAYSSESLNLQDWIRRFSGNIDSSLLVPRAHSVCVRAI